MLAERTPAGRFRNGQGTFPLHDVRYPQPPASASMVRSSLIRTTLDLAALVLCNLGQGRVVKLDGIEPTTSCLQSTRSPN